MKVFGSEWSGHRRVYTVFTGDADPGYACGRRELVCLFPSDGKMVRLPPAFNIRHAHPLGIGLVALVGLLQTIILETPAPETESQAVDWIYLISDDLQLPVLFTSRLDNSQVNTRIMFCKSGAPYNRSTI